MTAVPILILAAGASSRMRGADKLLQAVAGQPLLRQVASRACDVSDHVFVALHHRAADRLTVMEGLPVTPLLIKEAAEGMGGTKRGAVAALPPCPAFMLLLADLPEITADDMRTVLAAREAHPDALIWRGATTDRRAGHPIVFDAGLRPRFAELGGDSGGESLVRPLGDRTHLVPFDTDRARLDLDTPEDWAAYRARRP